MKTFNAIAALAVILCISLSCVSQVKLSKKSPKLILGAVVNYNYVVGSANGSASSFTVLLDDAAGTQTFNSSSLGMQQGAGATLTGKYAINKKRNLYATGELGYNIFYNTEQGGSNRTKWSIFNIAPGIELSHRTAPNNKVFAGLQLHYSFIFGGWQSNITYPDNFQSNVYFRFKPASRLGMSIGTGMEFKTGRKNFLVLGIRGTWANMLPKNNQSTTDPYVVHINDAQNSEGIEFDNSKEIIYLQLFTGMNFSIR